jgi:hypothetical protein
MQLYDHAKNKMTLKITALKKLFNYHINEFGRFMTFEVDNEEDMDILVVSSKAIVNGLDKSKRGFFGYLTDDLTKQSKLFKALRKQGIENKPVFVVSKEDVDIIGKSISKGWTSVESM